MKKLLSLHQIIKKMRTADLKYYLKMSSVPAGIILDRLIRQQQCTKVGIGLEANLIPQRLNDLIKGNRRFTPENSLALEKALGIGIAGFFYQIQANHDIYKAQRKTHTEDHPNLNILTKTTFWDVDLNKVNWRKDQFFVIHRALEYGNVDEIRELSRFYGKDAIYEVYRQPTTFRLYEKVKQTFNDAAL